MKIINLLLRLSRPIYLLLAALTYVLGAGVARYLGNPRNEAAFWLGLGDILLMQVSMNLLAEVFRPANEPIAPEETRAERTALRSAALYISIAALAAAAVIAFLLFSNGRLAPVTVLFLGLSLLLVLTYGVPPLRLVSAGFGEFALAAHLAYVIPSLGFLFQAAEYHRLLAAVVLPLTALALALFLVLDFPVYVTDLKYARRSLLVRLGWERAVPLHHGLVLLAYLLFAVAPLLGFSLAVLWPAFLTLPFALLEIFWLRNITLGARPIWNLLTANSVAVFGLTVYLLTLTFWLR